MHGDSTSEGKIKGREECGRLCFLEWVSIGSFFVECDLFDGIWVGQESIKKKLRTSQPRVFSIDFYNIIRLVNHCIGVFYDLSTGENTSDVDVLVQNDDIGVFPFLKGTFVSSYANQIGRSF